MLSHSHVRIIEITPAQYLQSTNCDTQAQAPRWLVEALSTRDTKKRQSGPFPGVPTGLLSLLLETGGCLSIQKHHVTGTSD